MMILVGCAIAFAVVAGVLVWRAATRWWHCVVIAGAALALFPLLAQSPTGDVSRYLPKSAFADGRLGLDPVEQIILACTYATLALGIICTAAAFWAVRIAWERRSLRRK